MSSGLKWTLILVFAVACAVLVTAGQAMAQCGGCSSAKSACDAKSECTAKCPICGGEVSKEASIDYKGGKLCFCGPKCLAKFKEGTAKYQAKANEQLVITGQAKQVRCPCGGKPDPSTKMKVCDIDVCFCCDKCQEKMKSASAEKQFEMLFAKGFDKAFAVKQAKKQAQK